MPYVITTKPHESVMCDEADPGFDMQVSRVAVATLEEARNAVGDIINELPSVDDQNVMDRLYDDAGSFGVNGDTIGPLPDGTIIEVQPITIREIAETVDANLKAKHRARAMWRDSGEIIAAFNAS